MVVYKTTNIITGKIYIGKDESNNPLYLGSGRILKKAIKKYGKNNFIKEIIEECSSRESLNEKEIYWINKYNSTDPKIGYNIAQGGTGGNTYFGKNESELEEIKLKISNSLKDREFTDNHREKLSKSASLRKGNKPCKFKNQKMDEYLGETYSNEIKDKIRKSLKEHYASGMSEEQKQKISKALKGRKLGPMSDEHREKLKESFKKRDAVKREKLINKYIEQFDFFLENGVEESNYEDAKKSYRRVRDRILDMSKYSKIMEQFKIISHNRRVKANVNRRK